MTQKRKPTTQPDARQTPAGVPPRDEHNKPALDAPDRTGRPRDEGADLVERSGPQPARPEASGILSSDIDPDDRETL